MRAPRSPEYRTWSAMKTRCTNPKHRSYARYGGRGISICDRWSKSFAAFLADMGPRPSLDYTIERIDNDGNYEPGNCRWATHLEQQQNTLLARRLSFGGKTQALAQWARDIGICPSTLSERIRNWGLARALSTERQKKGGHGKPMTKAAATSASGYKGVYRKKNGWESRIRSEKKVHYLGYFHTPEAAAHAYDEAAKRLHGEYAKLNFPESVLAAPQGELLKAS